MLIKVSTRYTLNKNNHLLLKTLLFFFLANGGFVFAQNEWDGDNPSGNFTYGSNYNPDGSDGDTRSWSSATDFSFKTINNFSQTSVYWDLPWKAVRTIYYDAIFNKSIDWNGNGNGIDLYYNLQNYSSYTQYVKIPLSAKGAVLELHPINGDLVFTQPIYNDNNVNYFVYGNTSKLLTFTNTSNLVGNSSVNLYLKQYSKVLWDVNNAAGYSGGTFIENGEFWIGKSGKVNGATIQIGNGNSNTCKLFLSDASIATIASNSIVVPSNSSNSYIGGLNSSNTHTFSGTVNLNNNTVNLEEVSSTGTLLLSGAISGTGGGIKTVGVGTVRLSSTSNNYTGSTTTQAGILQLGASGVIPDVSPIVLNGGTFSTGATTGFSETAGTLQLTNNSTIALGTGNHTLTFAASNLVAWPGSTLTITGWTGGSCSATGGRIFFGAASGTLTAPQLAKISFTGYAGTATLLATGEIVPTVYVTAALNGIYYIPSSCYPTVASAVTALNTYGIAGPVTFNVAAGHTETAPSGGFSITSTGTVANTITFQKFGTGTNPIITASAAHTASSIMDGVFKIVGGDYITIDGFTMIENPANIAIAAMTEFGVGFFYSSTTNGAQNNTIKNCTITLNKTNTNTFGIYSSTQHTSTNGGSSAPISNLTGANSNNKFYSNTISNVNNGIVVNGTYGFESPGIDIGGASLSTSNTITDQGNAATVSYTGLPGTSTFGILVSNCTGSNISYNSITGNAAANNSYGIYLRSSSSPSPTLTHTSTISYNTVKVSCSSSTSSYNVVGILNDMGGTSHTLNITNNTIQNSTTTSTTFGGGFGGIWSTGAMNTIAINSNTISNNTIKGSNLGSGTATRCALIKITNLPTNSITVSSNILNTNNFNNSGTGDIVAFDVNGNYAIGCAITNNSVDGLSTSGTGSITGYFNTGSPTGALTVSGNTFKNINITGGGASSWIRFAHSVTGANQVLNFNTNTIENLTLNTGVTSSGVTGIFTSLSNNVTIYNNTIKNITSAGPNLGINTSGGSGPHNVYGNTIDGMTSSAAGGITHYGLYVSPSSGISNVYSNKVYNISSSTSTNASIYGISAGNGTTCNLYNNMIGDLKMPNVTNTTSSVLRGIHMSTATTNNVYNNSVYLNATSTGTDFSSTALSFSATGNLDLRNNILVNNSTPNGLGYSAAIMRTAAGTNGTVPANYVSTSNNNCLYAPSVTNGAIYVEGQYTGGSPTNVYLANCTDINAFKAFVSSRESNSFSEMPPFISTTAGSMDLHLNTAASSGCFDGGATIALTTPDIDGNGRPIGSAYEIGADEANGTNTDKTPPVISYTALSDVGCSSTTTLTATITDANAIGSGANAPRLYYKKLSDATNTIATVNNNTVNGWKYVVATGTYNFTFNYALLPGGLVQGDVIQYFVAAQDVSGNVATTSATVTPCVTSVIFTSAQTVSSPPTINQFTYRTNLSGPYTIGTGSGQNYPTLSGTGGLFEAINNGYVAGNITVTVTSNTVETGVVSLNEWTEYNSGTCALTGTTVYRLTVQSDGAVRTLEGTNLLYNATSLKAMINLNGADRVTFTGGTTIQRNLVFRTTNTTATSCVPVFQMGNVNGSNDIIIKNCDVQTNGTSGAAPISAGIYITNTGTNSNNLFQLNDIHDAVSGTTGNPRFGIYAENNTATVLQVRDNNFYNIFNKAIQLGVTSIGNGQTVTGNSIYNTGVGSVSNSFTAIELLSATTSGHTITGNYIGGTSALGGIANTPWTSSVFLNFNGINVTSSAATQSAISNNVVRNLNCSIATAVAFIGISFTGNVLCSGNTVGGSATFAITLNGVSSTGASTNYAILASSGGSISTAVITNNTISYITHNTSSTGVPRLQGINVSYPSSSIITVNGNTITDLSSSMRGPGNAYSATTVASLSGIIGIFITTVSGATLNIYENTLSNLNITSTSTTAAPAMIGIAIDGNNTCSILRNKIYNLNNAFAGSVTNPGNITAIRNYTGTNTIANNMIYLTNGGSTNRCRVMGIYDFGNTSTIHYNSIIIEGTDGGTTPTAGICSAPYSYYASSGTHDIKNNIFINNRTGGNSATVSHYAIAIPQALAGTFTCNYNNLVNSVSSTYCRINSTSYTLAGWQALTTPSAPDANSIAVTPTFTDSANGDLHLITDSNCGLDGKGIAVTITSDFDVPLITRATPPDIGADEFTSTYALAVSPVALSCNVANADLTTAVNSGTVSTPALLSYWTDLAATSSPVATPTSVPAGTYYIKYGSCTPPKTVVVSVQAAIYNSALYSGNTPANWSVAPDTNKALIFNSSFTSAGAGAGNLSGCNCTVNSPSVVTISSGDTMTLQNEITVTGGSITFNNTASLLQTAGTTNTNSGDITYIRTTRAMRTYDYVYWGSPITKTGSFSQIPSAFDRYYKFVTTGGMNGTYTPLTTDNIAGQGYITRVKNDPLYTPTPSAINYSFVGMPNNGVVNITATNYDTSSLVSGNTILLGNPYPSAIDADAFIAANIKLGSPGPATITGTINQTIGGALYFWTSGTAYSGTGSYNFADYCTYTKLGTANGVPGTAVGGLNASGKIAAGQGFFAQIFASGQITFNNSMRVAGNNTNFFRNANSTTNAITTVEKHRIWLNYSSAISNNSPAFRQLLVGYADGATNGIDNIYEGHSFTNNQIDFYSIVDNQNFSVQARALPFLDSDVVPLGFRTTTTGDYIINIDHVDGLFAEGQPIFLEDKELNIIYDLRTAPYSFNASAGRFDDRFVLRYTNNALSNPNFETLNNSVVVAVNNHELTVKSYIENMQEVTVYDILGRQLFQAKNINNNNFLGSNISLSQQTLIVKIKLENGSVVTRKVIL